uniref:Uncharacterized protein n=1 Tax=viral metagenome TaxID=1070528 RepID=A0A6M3JKV2_9ZZZZ
MKCPKCGINHRKVENAHHCNCQIQNEWGNYIILCIDLPGRTTEENMQTTFPEMGIENFRKVKKEKETMDEYMAHFAPDKMDKKGEQK